MCRVGRACCIVVRKDLIDWIVLLFFFFQRDSNKRKEKSKYSPRLLSFFLTEIAFRNCLRLIVYFYQSPHWRKGITWIIKKKKRITSSVKSFRAFAPTVVFLRAAILSIACFFSISWSSCFLRSTSRFCLSSLSRFCSASRFSFCCNLSNFCSSRS